MNNKIKLFTTVLFFGSIWGILEATLGHVLHFIPTTIAGSIMFPIASYILYKTYQRTESKASLFYVGVIAAAIKSVDLLLPSLSVFKTINPMISILLESLVVVLVMSMLLNKKPQLSYTALPIASLAWRSVFIAYMGLQFVITGNLAPFIKSFEAMFMFVVVSGLLMLLLADKVATFLTKNRMYEVLGLFILFIVGIMLITEGGHLAHLKLFGNEIVPMSQTTFYFVIAILVVVDVVQGKYQKKLLAAKKK